MPNTLHLDSLIAPGEPAVRVMASYHTTGEKHDHDFYELVYVANNRMIEEEPETLRAFLRGCERGFADFRDDTDAVLQILLENQSADNFPLSPTVEKKSAEVLLPLMETEDASFGTQSAETWEENIRWMKERGLISREPEVSEVMVDLGE